MWDTALLRRLVLFWLPILALIGGMIYVSQTRYQPEKEAQYGLQRLNHWRRQAGVPEFERSPILQKAAVKHAQYLGKDPDGHDELNRSNPHFTGKTPQERAIAAGYPSGVGENLTISTWARSGKRSVDGLMTALYHRLSLLSPDYDEAGAGWARGRHQAFVVKQGSRELRTLCENPQQNGKRKRYILTLTCSGNETQIPIDQPLTQHKMAVKYPIGAQIEPIYDGTERPNPMPDYGKTGNPISISFHNYGDFPIKMLSFELYHQGARIHNVKILTAENDPNRQLLPTEFALFPIKPLAFEAEYEVRFKYVQNQQEHTESWSFKTRKKRHFLEF